MQIRGRERDESRDGNEPMLDGEEWIKIHNYNTIELETWDQRNAMTTGRKWKHADLSSKLNNQRASAREGTVSRSASPPMGDGQGGKQKTGSDTGESQICEIPRER